MVTEEKKEPNAAVSAHVTSGLLRYRFASMVPVSVSFRKSEV